MLKLLIVVFLKFTQSVVSRHAPKFCTFYAKHFRLNRDFFINFPTAQNSHVGENGRLLFPTRLFQTPVAFIYVCLVNMIVFVAETSLVRRVK